MLGWRRWSELSGLERVWLYTRQSLYSVLVLFNGALVVGAVNNTDGSDQTVVTAGAVLVTVAGLDVLRAAMRPSPTTRPVSPLRLAPLLVLCAALIVTGLASLGDDAKAAAVTIGVTSLVLPLSALPDRRISVAVVVFAGVVFGISGGEVWNVIAGVAIATGLAFTSRASLWLLGIVAELDTARTAQGQLAVAEERLRFSRDVHDVLGRRLSTIAVQSELASTLAERGDPRAAERMLEVRGVAHEALREARELARGYRRTDFASELEGARSLLRSAGIEVTADADGLPRGWHEAAGWVVRESVTNVLRHSDATLVEVTHADGELRVANDGARPGTDGTGQGLIGLKERLAPLGATLDTQADGDRWTVVVRFPGTGPLSATSNQEPAR